LTFVNVYVINVCVRKNKVNKLKGNNMKLYTYNVVDSTYITKSKSKKAAREEALHDYSGYIDCCAAIEEAPELTKEDFLAFEIYAIDSEALPISYPNQLEDYIFLESEVETYFRAKFRR